MFKSTAKRILTVTFAITLTLIVITVQSARNTAPIETIIKVEPTLIEFGNPHGDPIPPEYQFNVAIKIYNITNFYGLDLKLKWNTTFLRYISHSVYIPKDTNPDGVLWNPTFRLADTVDAKEGTCHIAYVSMYPAPSFNGTGTVFAMTFEILKQPYDYETGGPGVDPTDITVDFLSTDLAAFGGDPIQHTAESATIRIWEKRSEPQTQPIIKIMPETVINMPINKTFDVNVWIFGIDSKYNVERFNITLNFNHELIKAVNITEGSWPINYANNVKEIQKQINNAQGTITYTVELIPPIKPEPPTAGILFTVTFNVTYESPTHPPPTSKITPHPTELLDRNIGPIPHITEDATYTALRIPPTAKFTWTPSSYNLPRNQPITFNASESYHPTGIKQYLWDFGDGNKTTLQKPIITHTYKTTGAFTVVLNVTDNENFWAVTNVTIHVVEQAAPTVSVINPLTGNASFTFYTNATPVGHRFNATIHVYNAADLKAYQISLEYNSTLLKCTGAWLPTWDPKWVFYGRATTAPKPTFEPGRLQIADHIKGYHSTFSGDGLLCTIEFEITYAPTAGEISCSLNIENANTFLLDSNGIETASVKTIGNYIYIHRKINSTISITITPSIINFGEKVTIKGAVTPPSTTNVTLFYKLQGDGEWTKLETVQTSPTGQYTYYWKPEKTGTYEIKANWPGDQNTYPAESEHRTVKVETQPKEVPYIAILTVIIAAIIIAAAIYSVKLRKPHKP